MRIERQLLFWFGAGLALLGMIALLSPVLLPFVAGIVIAYFLNPVADRLQRMGCGRMLSAVLIVVAVGVLVAIAAVLLVPFMANQFRQLAETMPVDLAKLEVVSNLWLKELLGERFPGVVSGLERALAELAQSWTASVGAIARALWSQGLAIVNFLSLLLITPVVVFYLLVDWHPMLQRVDGWLPREHAGTIRRLANEINEAVSAFIRGQGTICLILGVFYAGALMVIGLPYGVLIGLLTGVMTFVPIVGWALGFLVAAGTALAHGWPSFALLAQVAIVFGAGMAIDSAVLSPKIVGQRIGLHPVWLIFSLMAFSYLFGFVGMLVAVPVAAAVAVIVRFGLESYLGSMFYTGPGDRDGEVRQKPASHIRSSTGPVS